MKRPLYIRKGKRIYDYYTGVLIETCESDQHAYAKCIIFNNQPPRDFRIFGTKSGMNATSVEFIFSGTKAEMETQAQAVAEAGFVVTWCEINL